VRVLRHTSAMLRPLSLLLASMLLGCGVAPEPPETSSDAGGDRVDTSVPTDAPSTDASRAMDVSPDAARTDLVSVSHTRELRGVWVSTVFGLDYPTATGLSETAARAELAHIVDRSAAAGINAIFFQIRPESDALYESSLEPWSRFLTGTQGRDPGYDPLAILLELAHAQGIEVHAWMNPYRALTSASVTAAADHVTHTLAAHAIPYGDGVTMDPGAAPVRAHVVEVVRDVLGRYAVDGIHFDDYFYPYPDADRNPYPDDASFDAYTAGGGTMSRADWRRENVNALVRDVHAAVLEVRPSARFGISPFGIYRPGMPAGIAGLDAYASIYCDALAWIEEGTVDYVAPQLYWPTTPAAQAYEPLATWWADQAPASVHIFPGHAAYRVGSTPTWTLDELETQLTITRSLAGNGALGDLFFRFENVDSPSLGVHARLVDFYAAPAAPPAIPRTIASPDAPDVTASAGSIDVSRTDARLLAVYRETAGTFALERLVVPSSGVTPIDVGAGTWAVSAIGVGDGESMGARIVVP
jgi:uncharacterized lipoprotein YddW (UPF0748 family)